MKAKVVMSFMLAIPPLNNMKEQLKRKRELVTPDRKDKANAWNRISGTGGSVSLHWQWICRPCCRLWEVALTLVMDFAFGILLTFLQHEIEFRYFEVKCQNTSPDLLVNKTWQRLSWSKLLSSRFVWKFKTHTVLYSSKSGMLADSIQLYRQIF